MTSLTYTHRISTSNRETLHIHQNQDSKKHPDYAQDPIRFSVSSEHTDKNGQWSEAWNEIITNDGDYAYHDGLSCATGHLFTLTRSASGAFEGKKDLKDGELKLSLTFSHVGFPEESATLVQTFPNGKTKARTFAL